MNRMGHDRMRAALIYQHATQKADRKTADALGRLLAEHSDGPDESAGKDPDDGTGAAVTNAG
jgi:hypothetical protein